MMIRTVRIATVAALAIGLGGLAVTGPVTAAGGQSAPNAALEWNAIASNAITTTAAQSPQAAALSLGMVQGAVYDAVNAIDGGYQPYLAAPRAHKHDSEEAAATAAAFRVLVGFPERSTPLPGLVPEQLSTLRPLYNASLAAMPDGPAKTGGIVVGEKAAATMLVARTDDGRGGPFAFVPGTAPGQWRPAPPQGATGIVARDPAPWVGFVKPFIVPDAAELRTDGPNALTSRAYAKDFNEVKRVGSLTSTRRTADQTASAIFWQDNGVAIWNRVYRELASSHHLGTADTARLFAMTNLAAADGAIGCWNDKAYWSFWRPITAIRNAATDGNPATKADPNWLPLFDPSVPVSGPPLVTPGFPDHPAGHACITSATVHALQEFFGTDKISFTATSNKCAPAPCPTRTFHRLSAALREVINARVWSGIHFRTADEQGAVLGSKVVRYMTAHYFKPEHAAKHGWSAPRPF